MATLIGGKDSADCVGMRLKARDLIANDIVCAPAFIRTLCETEPSFMNENQIQINPSKWLGKYTDSDGCWCAFNVTIDSVVNVPIDSGCDDAFLVHTFSPNIFTPTATVDVEQPGVYKWICTTQESQIESLVGDFGYFIVGQKINDEWIPYEQSPTLCSLQQQIDNIVNSGAGADCQRVCASVSCPTNIFFGCGIKVDHNFPCNPGCRLELWSNGLGVNTTSPLYPIGNLGENASGYTHVASFPCTQQIIDPTPYMFESTIGEWFKIAYSCPIDPNNPDDEVYRCRTFSNNVYCPIRDVSNFVVDCNICASDGRDGVFTGGTLDPSKQFYFFSDVILSSDIVLPDAKDYWIFSAGGIEYNGYDIKGTLSDRIVSNFSATICDEEYDFSTANCPNSRGGRGGIISFCDPSGSGQTQTSDFGYMITHGGDACMPGSTSCCVTLPTPGGAGGVYPGGDGQDAPQPFTQLFAQSGSGGGGGCHGRSHGSIFLQACGDINADANTNIQGEGEDGGRGGNGSDANLGTFTTAERRPGGGGGAGGNGGDGMIVIMHSVNGSVNYAGTINVNAGSGGAGGLPGQDNGIPGIDPCDNINIVSNVVANAEAGEPGCDGRQGYVVAISNGQSVTL